MHRDIVPRAFACDYSLVADILRSWGPGFKAHGGLAHGGRKHMYYFVGGWRLLTAAVARLACPCFCLVHPSKALHGCCERFNASASTIS